MYNFYNNMPEKRTAWRNAYEIKAAALEHEKRRFQMMHEYNSLAKPQVLVKGDRKSGWSAVFKAPLRLLAILIG
jgi:hypothetical protein